MNRDAARAFAKAVFWGGVGAAVPGLLVTVPLGLNMLIEGDRTMGVAGSLYLIVMPLLVTWPLALGGMLLLGLPITWLFQRSGKENGRFYLLAGMVAGSLPFLLLGLHPDFIGLMLASVPGGLGGIVAGWHWGRHRDAMLRAGAAEA